MAARSWQAFVERPEQAAGRVVTLTAARPELAELQVGDAAYGQTRAQTQGQLSWDSALELALTTAFLERPICLVSYDPPLEWGDLELAALGASQTTLQHGGQRYTLVSLAAASQAALAEVARSQDFRHGTLRVAALAATPAEQLQRFLTTLQEAGALYPPWEEWVQSDQRSAAQVIEAERERKLRGGQEFMECNQDGDLLAWYHPPAEALERYAQALRALAETRGLRFRTEIS